MVAEGVVGGYFRPRSERVHAPGALKRRLPNIREKPTAFRGGMERRQQALEGTEMVSNVYQIHFLDTQLPEGDSEKARFAREYVTNLVGAESAWEVTFFMQPSNLDPSCRITISSCVVPGSFQVRHFGVTIDPRSVSDHPQRQGIIADTLVQHIPDLPEEARDFLNWTWTDADEETGAVTIHW